MDSSPQAVLLGELTEAPEVGTRRLGIARGGRHRHQAAHVGLGREERRELFGLDPGFRRLACEVDLDEGGNRQPAGRGLGVQ